MNHDRKYFEFHELTGRRFSDGAEPASDPNQSVRYTGILPTDFLVAQAELSEHHENGSHHRKKSHSDFPKLFALFGTAKQKSDLYKLYALAICKIHLLKINKAFLRLRNLLVRRIRETRNERLQLETNGGNNSRIRGEIENYVSLENHLVFGVALLSYLDQHRYDKDTHEAPSYETLVKELLGLGYPQEESDAQFPLNFAAYLGDENSMWAISSLMILSHHRFARPDRFVGLKDDLATVLKSLINRSERLLNTPDAISKISDSKSVKDTLGSDPKKLNIRIKSNLDMLLTELGKHELKENHEVIRFLQLKLIYEKKDHSPITTAMQRALKDLGDMLARHQTPGQAASDEAATVPKKHQTIELPQSEKEKLQAVIEDAIYAAGTIEQIAAAMPEFFRFTSARKPEITRYTEPETKVADRAQRFTFPSRVVRLSTLLDQIRERNRISIDQFEEIEQSWKWLYEEMFDNSSKLREFVKSYILDIDRLVAQAIDDAITTFQRKYARYLTDAQEESKSPADENPETLASLEAEQERHARFVDALISVREKLEEHIQEDPAQARYVLGERFQFIEFLKNVFTNMRHAYVKEQHYHGLDDMIVIKIASGRFQELSRRDTDSDDTLVGHDCWRVVVEYPGGQQFKASLLPEKDRSRTISRHRIDAAKLGARYSWGNRESGGTQFTMEFFKREFNETLRHESGKGGQ